MLNSALIMLGLNFEVVVSAGFSGYVVFVVALLLADGDVVFLVTPHLVAW
jgi:hypothetical protein